MSHGDQIGGKTYWLIGASEGLGRALAQSLANAGAKLILSARSETRLIQLAQGLQHARVLPLDVTDDDSIEDAIAGLGPVDGVIYCAGSYEPMRAEDWNTQQAMLMCETNFIGAMRVLGRIVPRFAQQRSGHIVLIGSLAGHEALPGSIGYGSSKAALMHLGASIHADLRGQGVKVQVANPGFIKTRLTDKNDFKMPQIMSPETAAAHVVAHMRSRRFDTSFPRPFAWVFTVLGRFLPRSWFLRLMG